MRCQNSAGCKHSAEQDIRHVCLGKLERGVGVGGGGEGGKHSFAHPRPIPKFHPAAATPAKHSSGRILGTPTNASEDAVHTHPPHSILLHTQRQHARKGGGRAKHSFTLIHSIFQTIYTAAATPAASTAACKKRRGEGGLNTRSHSSTPFQTIYTAAATPAASTAGPQTPAVDLTAAMQSRPLTAAQMLVMQQAQQVKQQQQQQAAQHQAQQQAVCG